MGFLTCHSLSYSDLGKESSKEQMYPRLILLQALHLWVKRQHLDAALVNDQYFPIDPEKAVCKKSPFLQVPGAN